nr:AraC family transcriptional regulator [Thiorhodococcus minor]
MDEAGAPVGRLLSRAGIPEEVLEHPAAAIPLESGFRLAELACQSLGTEHLGAHIGLAATFDDLGPYGDLLRRSVTLGDYLRRGIRFYNMLITGQRFWLSEHGSHVRLNLTYAGRPGVGPYQSELESLVTSVLNIRHALPGWTPGEISLSYQAGEPLPAIELFSEARVLRGAGQTYITIPRGMLSLPFKTKAHSGMPNASRTFPARSLPEDLAGLVRHQIACLKGVHGSRIDIVAESLTLSRRTLQRELATQGLSFSALLTDVVMAQAMRWLENSEKPIFEIAFDLGYSNASNFTRAFRRHTGLAPQTFRDANRPT